MPHRQRTNGPSQLLALFLLTLASCGGEENTTAESLCDGSDGIRLTYVSAGGNLSGLQFVAHYGHSFLALDGGCHYWAGGSSIAGLHTGTLNTEMAAQLERDLHVREIPGLAGHSDTQSCPDASDTRLSSNGQSINCTCGCEALPKPIPEAFTAAYAAHETLRAAGVPFTGPLSAATNRRYEPKLSTVDALAWPLSWSPETLVTDVIGGNDDGHLIESESDRQALRTLRATAATRNPSGLSFIVQTADGTNYDLLLRDEPPSTVVDALKRR